MSVLIVYNGHDTHKNIKYTHLHEQTGTRALNATDNDTFLEVPEEDVPAIWCCSRVDIKMMDVPHDTNGVELLPVGLSYEPLSIKYDAEGVGMWILNVYYYSYVPVQGARHYGGVGHVHE